MGFWRLLEKVVCREIQWNTASRENGTMKNIKAPSHLACLSLKDKFYLNEKSLVCVVLWATQTEADMAADGLQTLLIWRAVEWLPAGQHQEFTHLLHHVDELGSLTLEWFKSKRQQRQNNSKNRNIIWEEDILYLFLSWSCEDLSLVVSLCFVRLGWLFNDSNGSIWLQADPFIYSSENSWLDTLHHFKEPSGCGCLGRPLPPCTQPQATNLIHANLVPLTAAILTAETWDKSVLGGEPRGALSANHSINRQQSEKPQSHEIMMSLLFLGKGDWSKPRSGVKPEFWS